MAQSSVCNGRIGVIASKLASQWITVTWCLIAMVAMRQSAAEGDTLWFRSRPAKFQALSTFSSSTTPQDALRFEELLGTAEQDGLNTQSAIQSLPHSPAQIVSLANRLSVNNSCALGWAANPLYAMISSARQIM